jgi:type IV pilus assembly protein PilF
MTRAVPILLASVALACAHGPTPKERETAEIHYNLGLDALRTGKAQEALKEVDEALKLDEAFADAHLLRGILMEFYFSKGDDAEVEYRRAIELRPGFSEARNNLGQLLARKGRYDEALKEFDAALANFLYKEPWKARLNRALVLYQMGRRAEGVAEIEALLKTYPRYCEGQRELGRIRMNEGQAQPAVEAFTQYARSCDKAPDAYFQLGLSLVRAGEAEKAREAFDKCASLEPDGPLADECRRSRARLQ